MIRQLLIGTVPPPTGGDALWAEGYLNYYKRKGHYIPLVNTSLIGKRAVTVDENRSFPDEIRRCIRIWRDLSFQIRLYKPNIVHMNINCSPLGTIRDFICACIIKRNKIPFVVHCHCNIQDQIGTSRWANKFLKALLRTSNGVIAINTQSLQFVEMMCQTKAKIIPNFVSDVSCKPKVKLSNEIQKVLYVGHIRKTKGIGELLQAAEALPNVQFLLVGTITDDFRDFKPNDCINGNVQLLGNVAHKRVLELLDSSDVFVFPSYTEGFSLALVEAMSRGIPCIASDVGANKDMIEDCGGVIIPPRDAKAIVNAINRLASKDARKHMGEWNVEKVRKCYTIDSVMVQLEEYYKEVLNE